MPTIHIKKNYFFILIPIILSSIAILYSEFDKKEDYKEMQKQFYSILNGKKEITASSFTKPEGYLDKVNYRYSLNNYATDEQGKQLAEIYHLNRGGWSIVNLKKEKDGDLYQLEYVADIIGFKVPEYIIEDLGLDLVGLPIQNKTPTHRQSAYDAYKSSMNYLLNKNKNVQNDLYSDVRYFDFTLKSKYYKIKQSVEGHIDKAGYVYDNESIVYYNTNARNFSIAYNEEAYQKQLAINVAIALLVSLIFYIIFKLKPNIKIVE